jgi:hypothetical protein
MAGSFQKDYRNQPIGLAGLCSVAAKAAEAHAVFEGHGRHGGRKPFSSARYCSAWRRSSSNRLLRSGLAAAVTSACSFLISSGLVPSWF